MKKVTLAAMAAAMVLVSNGLALSPWESPKTLEECKMDVNRCVRHGTDPFVHNIYNYFNDGIVILDMACKGGITLGCLGKAEAFDKKGWDGYSPKKAKKMFATIFSEAVKKCENGDGSECYTVGYMYYIGDVDSADSASQRSNRLKYYDMACKLGHTDGFNGNPCEDVKYYHDEAIRKAQIEEAKK